MGHDEEIQQGDLRFQELMKERVWLREKSTIMEEEVKKLEEGIKKDFIDKKTMVIKQNAHNYIDKFGDYHRELISLTPWIRPYITRGVIDGGTMQMVKCVMQIVKLTIRLFQGKIVDGQLKPYTGGPTT